MLLLHVKVISPEDWMLVVLRSHETPAGAETASAIGPVNPL
jgi:hypothetical protein